MHLIVALHGVWIFSLQQVCTTLDPADFNVKYARVRLINYYHDRSYNVKRMRKQNNSTVHSGKINDLKVFLIYIWGTLDHMLLWEDIVIFVMSKLEANRNTAG